MYDGTLKLLYPLAIRPGETSIVVEEDAGPVTIDALGSIDRQDQFLAARGSAFTLNGWSVRPALQEIEDALNASSLSNTYQLQPATPDGRFADTGLKVVRTAGSKSFKLQIGDAGWALDPRILGWTTSETTVFDVGGEAVAPYSYLGAWHWDASPDGTRDLRHQTDRLTFESSIDQRFGWANAWTGADDGDGRVTGKVRRLYLRDVPGYRLLEARARFGGTLAEDGGDRDPHAQFEHAWATAHRGLSFLLPQHDASADKLTVDWPAEPTGIEAVQWADMAQLEEFREAVEDYGTPGETYNVDVDLHSANTTTLNH